MQLSSIFHNPSYYKLNHENLMLCNLCLVISINFISDNLLFVLELSRENKLLYFCRYLFVRKFKLTYNLISLISIFQCKWFFRMVAWKFLENCQFSLLKNSWKSIGIIDKFKWFSWNDQFKIINLFFSNERVEKSPFQIKWP